MGMYTELVVAFELKNDTPLEVISTLEFMVAKGAKGEKSIPLSLPAHPFFKTDRWDWMLNSGSYYFIFTPHSTIRYDNISKSYFVTIRCNLKNYTDEIEQFLDWINPYIDESEHFIGYKWYEENEEPTLLYRSLAQEEGKK